MSHQHEARPTHDVVLLGDHEMANQIDSLREVAAGLGASVMEVHAWESGEPFSTDDLTEVDEVVQALSAAIVRRADLWAPYPAQDLGEQHVRRLSLALQRHGLNLVIGPSLAPCPKEGGVSAADFALRAEVRAVDDLDRAALAAGAGVILSVEIEQELARHAADRTGHADARGRSVTRRDLTSGDDADTEELLASLQLKVLRLLEHRFGPAPCLPAPGASWAERQPALKEYARWLVGPCKVKRSLAAVLLNAIGQRTKQGREWQASNLGALVNGRYDGGVAA